MPATKRLPKGVAEISSKGRKSSLGWRCACRGPWLSLYGKMERRNVYLPKGFIPNLGEHFRDTYPILFPSLFSTVSNHLRSLKKKICLLFTLSFISNIFRRSACSLRLLMFTAVKRASIKNSVLDLSCSLVLRSSETYTSQVMSLSTSAAHVKWRNSTVAQGSCENNT